MGDSGPLRARPCSALKVKWAKIVFSASLDPFRGNPVGPLAILGSVYGIHIYIVSLAELNPVGPLFFLGPLYSLHIYHMLD